MLCSILIGLDGSADAEAAVALGLKWARDFDAKAIGVAVADEPGVLSTSAMATAEGFADLVDPLIEDERRHAAEILRSFAARCEAEGVRHEVRCEAGTPFEQLLVEAERADLVVLGRRTHFEYRWEKSPDQTLERVLRTSPRPVVTVPERPTGGDAVVVAYDGSVEAARALHAFEASGLARSRTIYVVSVSRERDGAAAAAGRAVDFLHAHDLDARPIPLDTGLAPAAVLLGQVRRLGAGLLVMGVFGQSAVREFFLGSVTRTALDSGAVPVFCDR